MVENGKKVSALLTEEVVKEFLIILSIADNDLESAQHNLDNIREDLNTIKSSFEKVLQGIETRKKEEEGRHSLDEAI